MNRSLWDCALYRRLLAGLVLLFGIMLLAAVLVFTKIVSKRMIALLIMGGAGSFFLLTLIFITRPLYHVESIFCNKNRSLEDRLHALSSFAPLGMHPLGRALQSLQGEVSAQYAADLLGKQAELSALQSQINPHFLYNTLDSIRGQAMVGGAYDIADMTEALSTFFRYSISNRNAVVSLEEELENVRNYFKIQQFRFNNRFRLNILPTARENLERCHLPKLSLQPIVENAILHGVEGKLGGSTITIRIQGSERVMQVTVSDDGVGIHADALGKLQAKLRGEKIEPSQKTASGRSTGMALANIAHRIRLLYGSSYGVEAMSTVGTGTDVILTLPLGGE